MKDKRHESRTGYEEGRPARHIRLPGVLLAGLLAATIVGGCDVTNPGPVQDRFLSEPEAHQGLVNGANRMVLEGFNWVVYTGALISREIFPTGQTGQGSGGHPVSMQGGALPEDQVDLHWNALQQARFIAEDAIRRFSMDEVGAGPRVTAQAYLWAGYANRVLGDNMCQAVFDGGPAEPNRAYWERAEEHFSNAIQHAQSAGESDDLILAATAGRAQARMWLEEWPGAVADASQIPEGYVFELDTNLQSREQGNLLWWWNGNAPYRGYTIRFTFFDEYYAETGDPRSRWDENPDVPFGNSSLSGFGQVPWSFSLKYPGMDADYPLAKGTEMTLIRAEALLTQGDWEPAMTLINAVRTRNISDQTGESLEPWSASSIEEAWTFLKRERMIELWLETRRLGDLRRWEARGTPGEIDWPDFEALSPLFAREPNANCFPPSRTERETNPNL